MQSHRPPRSDRAEAVASTSFVRRLEQTDWLDAFGSGLDGVTGWVTTKPAGRALRGDGFGHALHPPLTDVPLGCWLAVAVLDLIGGEASRPARRRLLGVGLLASVPAVATGLAEWRSPVDRAGRRVAVAHGAANLVSLALFAASWKYRGSGKTATGTAASMLGLAVSGVAAYLGGHLAIGRGVGTGER